MQPTLETSGVSDGPRTCQLLQKREFWSAFGNSGVFIKTGSSGEGLASEQRWLWRKKILLRRNLIGEVFGFSDQVTRVV